MELVNRIQKELEELKNEVKEADKHHVPVGTIVGSMIPPDSVPEEFRGLWALADGKAAPKGSEYAQLRNDLPDLRGMFIRGINLGRGDGKEDPSGERNPGDTQESLAAHTHNLDLKRKSVLKVDSDKGSNFWALGAGASRKEQITTSKEVADSTPTEVRPRNVSGSSTFSMVLARYDMMRRWNRRNYLERY